jgi:predicted Rossmann fold nucleotide-binding protein DprA/Smf involved in DNA uptake
MASSKKIRRTFNGMSYLEIQASNSNNRKKLKKEHQKWLRDNKYKNVGWDNVITLYQKIEELLDQARFGEMSLEELFLEADRIGNKYLDPEEIEAFNQEIAKEAYAIEELIDKQFPDQEIEIIDFSKTNSKIPKKRNQKTY